MVIHKYGHRKINRAVHWAKNAGEIALDQFRRTEKSFKSDESLVTEADREIERYLRERIESRYPSDRIIGEEEEARSGDGDSWYLDPIDGTAAYATELPIWTVSVGIWSGGQPKWGVLYAPKLCELYVTGESEVLKNGERLAPVQHDDWHRESLFLVPSDSHRNYKIDFPGKTRCLGSTAYHMAMVADGRVVGGLLGRVRIWDMAAVIAIGKRLNLAVTGLRSGQILDFETVLTGDYAPEPLIFANQNQGQKLRERVEDTE